MCSVVQRQGYGEGRHTRRWQYLSLLISGLPGFRWISQYVSRIIRTFIVCFLTYSLLGLSIVSTVY
jgi:hypothetical protein